MVAGVCHSLARQLRVDPLLVRLATILLVLSSGLGLVLYTACWALMPQEGRTESLVQQWFPQTRGWPAERLFSSALPIVVLAALVLAATSSWSMGPALVLGGLIWLAHRNRSHRDEVFATSQRVQPTLPTTETPGPSAPNPETEFSRAVTAWQERLSQVSAAPPQAPDTPAPQPQASPYPTAPVVPPSPTTSGGAADAVATSRPASDLSSRRHGRRRRTASWGLGLLVSGLAIGASVLVVSQTSTATLRLPAGVGLAVLSLALFLTWLFRWPRPRLAMVTALGLLCVGIAPLVVTPERTVKSTVQELRYSSPASLPTAPVTINAAPAFIDLRALDLSGQQAPAQLAINGQLAFVHLELPQDATVAINYRLEASTMTVQQGDEADQAQFSTTGNVDGRWPKQPAADQSGKEPDLVITIDMTASAVEVSHA